MTALGAAVEAVPDSDVVTEYGAKIWGDQRGYVVVGFGEGASADAAGHVSYSRMVEKSFLWPAEADALGQHVAACAASGDVFVTPGLSQNPLRKQDRRQPMRSRFLWADIDNGTDAQLARAAELCRAGSFTVSSGSGERNRHLYVALNELTAPEVVAALNRRLARAVGGDPSPAALNAYLRPPGSLNHKAATRGAGTPTAVAFVEVSEGGGWSVAELDELLPEDGRLDVVAGALAGPDVPAEPLPDQIPPTVARILADRVEDVADRSARTMTLVAACKGAGLTVGQSITAAALHRPTVERHRMQDGRIPPALVADVARCYGKATVGLPGGGHQHGEEDGDAERDLLRLRLVKAGRAAVSGGGAFVLDAPARPEPVWGAGDLVLASAGEPTMIAGPTGVGKTTIAQQVVLARIGLRGDALGFRVQRDERKVLYLACDRPSQAARSMRRMVAEHDREALDERLVFWKGPLPHDLARSPDLLAIMAETYGAGMVVIDSLKDVVVKVSDDETGAKANQAFQRLCVEGVELVVLHHQRKAQAGASKPNTLADVYGSTWLTAGMGSVLVAWGDAGDPVVELSHLKQPVEQVGPLILIHDHAAGETTVQPGTDLLDLLDSAAYRTVGLTAVEAAKALYGVTATPTAAQTEKARRKLDKLVAGGVLHKRPGGRSDATGHHQHATYHRTP